MTQFLNITEIRTEISSLVKRAKKGDEVILLKNGKPTLALMPYADYERYTVWKEKQKILDAISVIQKESDRLKLGKKWLDKQGKNIRSEEEILDLIANE